MDLAFGSEFKSFKEKRADAEAPALAILGVRQFWRTADGLPPRFSFLRRSGAAFPRAGCAAGSCSGGWSSGPTRVSGDPFVDPFFSAFRLFFLLWDGQRKGPRVVFLWAGSSPVGPSIGRLGRSVSRAVGQSVSRLVGLCIGELNARTGRKRYYRSKTTFRLFLAFSAPPSGFCLFSRVFLAFSWLFALNPS